MHGLSLLIEGGICKRAQRMHTKCILSHDSLTDELLISPWKSEHKLCPNSQSKDIQGVHELAEIQPKGFSRPGTAVLRERLHARTATKPNADLLSAWPLSITTFEDGARYTVMARDERCGGWDVLYSGYVSEVPCAGYVMLDSPLNAARLKTASSWSCPPTSVRDHLY